MLSKKILQRISIRMYEEVSCRTLKLSVRQIMEIKMGDDSDLTLKAKTDHIINITPGLDRDTRSDIGTSLAAVT